MSEDSDAWALFGESEEVATAMADAAVTAEAAVRAQRQLAKEREESEAKLDEAWLHLTEVQDVQLVTLESTNPAATPSPRAPFVEDTNQYQAPWVAYKDDILPASCGMRGFIVTQDVQPGTLLLAEQASMPPVKQGSPGETQEEQFLWQFLRVSPSEMRLKLQGLSLLHPHTLADTSVVSAEQVQQLRERHGKGVRGSGAVFKMLTALSERFGVGGEEPDSELLKRLDEEELLRLLCVVHFNCFSSGLYLHLAIINHSCRPNCVKNFVKEDGCSEIWSTEFIAAGTEVTINYLDRLELARANRQHRLWRQFQFHCACSLCKLPLSRDAQALESLLAEQDCSGMIEEEGEEKSAQSDGKPGGNKDSRGKAQRWRRNHVAAFESTLVELERKLNTNPECASSVLSNLIRLGAACVDVLGPRHMTLARVNKLTAEVCSLFLARTDVLAGEALDCAAAVKARLPTACVQSGSGIVVELMELFLISIVSLRKTQLLFLGQSSSHPSALETLGDLSQVVLMLMGQGREGRSVLLRHFGSVASATRCQAACHRCIRQARNRQAQAIKVAHKDRKGRLAFHSADRMPPRMRVSRSLPGPTGEGQIFSLTYTSVLVEPLRSLEAMRCLAELSAKKNHSRSIGGVLGVDSTLCHVIQTLEGEYAAVRKLFAVIKADRRHKEVKITDESWSDKRAHALWGMEFDSPLAFCRDPVCEHERRELEASTGSPATSIAAKRQDKATQLAMSTLYTTWLTTLALSVSALWLRAPWCVGVLMVICLPSVLWVTLRFACILYLNKARIAHHVRAHGFRMAAHISFGLSLLLTIPWLAWLCLPATDQAWLKSFNLLGAGLAAQAEASSAPFVLDRPGFSAGLVLLSLVCVYVNWSALLMLPSPANFRLYTPNKRFFVHHATILYVCCLEYGAMALCCAVFALPQTWVRLRALGLFLSVLAYIMSVVGCACEVWTRRGVAWEEMWEAGLAVCQRGPWTVAEGGTKKPKHRISRLMLNFQTFDQKTLFWSIQAFLWIGVYSLWQTSCMFLKELEILPASTTSQEQRAMEEFFVVSVLYMTVVMMAGFFTTAQWQGDARRSILSNELLCGQILPVLIMLQAPRYVGMPPLQFVVRWSLWGLNWGLNW